MKRFLFPLLMILAGCNLPPSQNITVNEWYAVSSGPDFDPFIRGMQPALINGGWKNWLNSPGWDDQLTITQRSLKFKADGLVIHLPFGRNANQDFDFAGFTTSQKDPRLKNVVDVPGFVDAWTQYLKLTGYKKIYFYYGYVGADHAVWDGLTDTQKKDLIYANLTPIKFLQANVLPLGISVGVFIDTLNQIADANDANWTIAIPAIKALGLMYGGEPWPNPAIKYLDDANYYSVMDMRSTWLFDPDFSVNGWNTWSVLQSKIKGPIMSFAMREWANNNYTETAEQMREKTVYSLKKYHQIAISPPDDPEMTAKKLKDLAIMDSTNCMPAQNGYKNCCTSIKQKLTCSLITPPN